MRYNDAVKELRYKKEKKFILYGEESYLKESFLKTVKNINSQVHNFYPGEESEAKSALFSSNFFEEDQTVVLHYFDDMKVLGFKELIASYEGLCVVVLSEDANIKTKALSDVIAVCVPVSCVKMPEYGPEYSVWLTSKASEYKFTFVDGAEDLLYKKIGPDMCILSKELEKLIIFKKEAGVITREDVEKVVNFSAVGSTYEILESLLKRDVPNSLKTVDMYLRGDGAIEELVFFLGHYFEKLYRMVIMHNSNMSPESMASILNMNSFLIKSKYLPRALSFGRDKLATCLHNIVGLESNLRTSSLKEKLFRNFIYSFI